MRHTVCLVVALSWASTLPAISIPMVMVGNPGNLNDPANGDQTLSGSQHFGAVNYVYNIGKYEVTAGEYTVFLNAVAKDDPNGLYNEFMGDPDRVHGANIQRSGSSPNYNYTVPADWADRPVNFVGFWDAARFANWLHNGQPIGAQGPGTTEDGAYHDVGDEVLFGRNPGARVFIPSENEWYKAAFHKNDGLTANYWIYPTASNATPGNTLPDPGNHANFITEDPRTGIPTFTIGAPYYRTTAGAFVNTPGPYGTFDQGGNVYEWNEEAAESGRRRIRGGWWATPVEFLRSSSRGSAEFNNESSGIGFRIASAVPEPASVILLLFGLLAIVSTRNRGFR